MSVMGFASEGLSPAEGGVGLAVTADGQAYNIGLSGAEPFYSTARKVSDERLIDVPGSPVLLALWRETSTSGDVVSHYAISLDGQKFSRARATSYILRLRYSNFDPLVTLPHIPDVLTADPATNEVYIVQFHTQPLQVFRERIETLGGTVHKFLNQHAYVVRMTPEVRDLVADLPYVRWVGAFHPAYRLEELLIDEIKQGSSAAQTRKYSIMLHERGPWPQQLVADRIEAIGGELFRTIPEAFRVEAFLTIDQVRRVVLMNEIMFMDIRGELELDMDIVREISGADYIENVGGYTGEGVRAEAADAGCQTRHVEFQGVNGPPLIHGPQPGVGSHGTAVYGVLFASGVKAQARGLLPDADQGIFAEASHLRGEGNITNRYRHTGELVDPNGPYRALFQTNSTGDPRTREYTTLSAAMDTLLFDHDIVHCQSMSNAGGVPEVRPQAWAKNIVGVGGVRHHDTLNRDDDEAAGSSGPAKDGRIKPDLAHFYDNVYTTYTTSTTGYGNFSGTSSATPCTCGHFGLFFQMWADGIFGNPVGGGDPFDEKAHMSTAKAVMINTAHLYPLDQGNLRRLRQGWGMVDLKNMFDLRDKFYIIDETDVLKELDVAVHKVEVLPGTPHFAATLVYPDPAGVPHSSKHRVNDLTLHVISPSGTEYWGNYGLANNNVSTPGGSANDIDTTENVFLDNPEVGIWSVEVIAAEINEDGHVETPQMDADYALVVSEVLGPDMGSCIYELKKDSKPKKGCGTCPKKGDLFETDSQCVDVLDCSKRHRIKRIDCPGGGDGFCKRIKGLRHSCGELP